MARLKLAKPLFVAGDTCIYRVHESIARWSDYNGMHCKVTGFAYPQHWNRTYFYVIEFVDGHEQNAAESELTKAPAHAPCA